MRPLSPAQRHRARIQQEQAQAVSPYGTELVGDAYTLMRIKLSQDKARISLVQSHERRAELKANLLPEYFDWINTATSTGTGATDQVLTTIMVWAFDAGAYETGLKIAEYVIRHRMPMADDYKRSPAAIVIDELSNAYLKGQWAARYWSAAEDGVITLAPVVPSDAASTRAATACVLMHAEEITAEQDAPDQARAKLHKAIAYAALGKVQTAEDPDLTAIEPEALQVALTRLQRALELDSNAGVKKDIERIERAIGKADKATDTAPPEATKQPATKPARPAAKKAPAKPRKPAARSK